MTMPDPGGPVVITLREIYDQIVQIRTTVDKLVGAHEDAEKQLVDHEARLRSLERGRWPLPAIAALVAVASLIVAALALVNSPT